MVQTSGATIPALVWRTLLREGRYAEAEKQTLAAYQILIKQSNPAESYMRAARKDLRLIYEGLHQPERAAQYQEPTVAAAAPAGR